MSYSELLNQYSQRMAESRGHEEDMTSQNIDRKRGMIEDAFKKISEPIAQAGEVLDSAGGSVIAGRKIYRKIQAGKNAAKAARRGAGKQGAGQGEGDNPSDGTGAQAKPATQKAATDDAPKQGGDDPITEDGSFFPDQTTGNADADNIFRDDPGNLQLKARQKTGTETAEADPGNPTPSATGPADDQAGQMDEALQAREAAARPTDPAATQDVSATDTLQGTGRATGADLSSAPGSAADTDVFSGTRSLGQSVVKTGAADATEAGEVGANSANEILSGAGKAVGNIANKAVTKVAGAAGDAMPELAEAGSGLAGQALDWMGPIGLGVGAVTGLVDLFENIFGGDAATKKADDVKGQIQGEGGGVDVGSMIQKQAPTTLV